MVKFDRECCKHNGKLSPFIPHQQIILPPLAFQLYIYVMYSFVFVTTKIEKLINNKRNNKVLLSTLFSSIFSLLYIYFITVLDYFK